MLIIGPGRKGSEPPPSPAPCCWLQDVASVTPGDAVLGWDTTCGADPSTEARGGEPGQLRDCPLSHHGGLGGCFADGSGRNALGAVTCDWCGG